MKRDDQAIDDLFAEVLDGGGTQTALVGPDPAGTSRDPSIDPGMVDNPIGLEGPERDVAQAAWKSLTGEDDLPDWFDGLTSIREAARHSGCSEDDVRAALRFSRSQWFAGCNCRRCQAADRYARRAARGSIALPERPGWQDEATEWRGARVGWADEIIDTLIAAAEQLADLWPPLIPVTRRAFESFAVQVAEPGALFLPSDARWVGDLWAFLDDGPGPANSPDEAWVLDQLDAWTSGILPPADSILILEEVNIPLPRRAPAPPLPAGLTREVSDRPDWQPPVGPRQRRNGR